jgi:hypothetical protein
MEHARRRCGRSCLGPGFESPRLHFHSYFRLSHGTSIEVPFGIPSGYYDKAPHRRIGRGFFVTLPAQILAESYHARPFTNFDH